MKRFGWALIVGFAVHAGAAQAADPPARTTVPKDPQGIKGISPFWEFLKRGDDAYLARNFDAAIDAFQSALAKEPQNPLGHYRLGEALRASGRLDEAEKAWTKALQHAGRDAVLKAKVLFVLADLRERQQNYTEAAKAWAAYGRFVAQNQAANGYPKSAGERKQRNEDYQRLVEQYVAVKARIEKRLREVDENARKNAR
jgi:tetratricopeptide (TPR) repeat protein